MALWLDVFSMCFAVCLDLEFRASMRSTKRQRCSWWIVNIPWNSQEAPNGKAYKVMRSGIMNRCVSRWFWGSGIMNRCLCRWFWDIGYLSVGLWIFNWPARSSHVVLQHQKVHGRQGHQVGPTGLHSWRFCWTVGCVVPVAHKSRSVN